MPVVDWPSAFVTTTALAPTVPAGANAVREVVSTKLTVDARLPPMATDAPAAKFVPVIVMLLPPMAGPEVGVTAVIVGAGPR